MSNAFRSHIRTALADENLRAALDANAEKRIVGRKKAFASLPNSEDLRQRAHAIRAQVIEHLDDYVEQFTTRAVENGMQVHQAANATQAVDEIIGLARACGAKLIAKSKTMVSEEIGLNHALEKQGFRVVETDLGEFIVQLRGETPSHIITPAVHLRRQDVGRLFEQKLGIPYTEEISLMTNAARAELRRVFLQADIGISGVNFGVAETGTICVVTNEGNGRMVTTLPRTHIALMGIERLVPTLDDLRLMLSLLPRSATGQKLSVYTSLLNGPRRVDDPDGPRERHVILVDNGRRAIQASALRESLYCIRCGSCLNACPVFREIGGHAYVSMSGHGSPYPGPIGSVISPALFGQLEYGHLARASSLCAACREACPIDIDLPKLLLRVRAGYTVNEQHPTLRHNAPFVLASGLHLYTIAASNPRRFAFAQWAAGIFGSIARYFSKGEAWLRLPRITGWGYSRDFPAPARKTFRSRYSARILENLHFENDLPLPNTDQSTQQESDVDHTGAQEDLLTLFKAELEALGATYSSGKPEEITQAIISLLLERKINEILAWDTDKLPFDIAEALTKAGVQMINPSGDTLDASSHVKAGLTGVIAGAADTGTLLLLGGQGKPLTASLLPDTHIALIHEKDVHRDIAEMFMHVDIKDTSAGVLVTGPSRTADIEMTLTIGVHGPGELHVFCITE